MNLFKRFRCNHDWKCVTNFCGDYVNIVSTPTLTNLKGRTYRSLWRCTKCGKEEFRGEVCEDCRVVNYYENEMYHHKL